MNRASGRRLDPVHPHGPSPTRSAIAVLATTLPVTLVATIALVLLPPAVPAASANPDLASRPVMAVPLVLTDTDISLSRTDLQARPAEAKADEDPAHSRPISTEHQPHSPLLWLTLGLALLLVATGLTRLVNRRRRDRAPNLSPSPDRVTDQNRTAIPATTTDGDVELDADPQPRSGSDSARLKPEDQGSTGGGSP